MAREEKELISQPQPDPWAPPGANASQATSIATALTGVGLMLGDEPATGVVNPEAMLAWLPDPSRLFSSAAHVLGFQFNASDAWSWGFVLVILSVALNIYSYALRYQYATKLEREYAAQKAADAAKEKQVIAQASRAGGFTPGDV